MGGCFNVHVSVDNVFKEIKKFSMRKATQRNDIPVKNLKQFI